jgi:hypothetical protein
MRQSTRSIALRCSFVVVCSFVAGCTGGTTDEDASTADGSAVADAAATTDAATDAAVGVDDAASTGIDYSHRCLPSMMCAGDPAHTFRYLCNATQSLQPETECVATTVGPAMGYCCAHPLCIRQVGTEYLCMDASRPNSFLCATGATPPTGCAPVGSAGVQVCCP